MLNGENIQWVAGVDYYDKPEETKRGIQFSDGNEIVIPKKMAGKCKWFHCLHGCMFTLGDAERRINCCRLATGCSASLSAKMVCGTPSRYSLFAAKLGVKL